MATTIAYGQSQVELGVYGAGATVQAANSYLATANALGGGASFRWRQAEWLRFGANVSYLKFGTADRDQMQERYRLIPMEFVSEVSFFTENRLIPYLNGTFGFYQWEIRRKPTGQPDAQEHVQQLSDLGFGGGAGVRYGLVGPLQFDFSIRYIYIPAEEGPQALIPVHLGLVYRFE
jgi:opacity protein-like surface antigen